MQAGTVLIRWDRHVAAGSQKEQAQHHRNQNQDERGNVSFLLVHKRTIDVTNLAKRNVTKC